MPVPKPRQGGAEHTAQRSTHQVAPPAGSEPVREAGKPATARLADDQAVPMPSPVHRLQAGLAQLTSPEEASPEQERVDTLYPGWFRLAFPLAASAVLWAAILWSVGVIA